MAAALAITGAKARDRIKLATKSLGNGALSPVLGLTEDYTIEGSSLQQIIDMPVRSFVPFKVAV